jgi:hypothetical protein
MIAPRLVSSLEAAVLARADRLSPGSILELSAAEMDALRRSGPGSGSLTYVPPSAPALAENPEPISNEFYWIWRGEWEVARFARHSPGGGYWERLWCREGTPQGNVRHWRGPLPRPAAPAPPCVLSELRDGDHPV